MRSRFRLPLHSPVICFFAPFYRPMCHPEIYVVSRLLAKRRVFPNMADQACLCLHHLTRLNFCQKPFSLTWILAEAGGMANLYLEFDEEAGNKTQHIIPKCYDAKDVNANSSERQLLINYMAKDGGIPVNFGLNILGWMVSVVSDLYAVLYCLNFLPCCTFYYFY